MGFKGLGNHKMGIERFKKRSLKNEVSFVFESSGGRHSESDISTLGGEVDPFKKYPPVARFANGGIKSDLTTRSTRSQEKII